MHKNSILKNSIGLTLVEIIFATAIGLILITAMVALYSNYSKNTETINLEIKAEQDGRVALEFVVLEILNTGRQVAKTKNPIVTANHNEYEFKYASEDFTDKNMNRFIKVTYLATYPSGYTNFGELTRIVKACSTKDFTTCDGTAIDGSTYSTSEMLISSLALDEGGSDPKAFTFEYFDKKGTSLNPGINDVIAGDLTKIDFVKVNITVSTSSKVWSASQKNEIYKTFTNTRQVKLRTLEK